MNDIQDPASLTVDANKTQLGAPPSIDPNRTIMSTAPSLNATVTIKPVQCPVCKTFNPAGIMFCIECGLIFDRALPDDVFGAPVVLLPCLVEQSGREHPIRPGTNMVGREGDVMLADPRVSRRHAQIVSSEDGFTVEDLGSTNGSELNGEPLQQGSPKRIEEGDKLSFGGVEVVLSLPGSAGATQVVPSNRTVSTEGPRLEPAVAFLVGGDLRLPLKAGVNSFGRKSENDAQIADPYVSGKHGVIEIADDGVYLTDTGSTNGTLINDAKLAPNQRTKISQDDEIRLGGIVLKVERN